MRSKASSASAGSLSCANFTACSTVLAMRVPIASRSAAFVPFGQAATHREGKDVTIIAIGSMVKPTLEAAKKLEAAGIDAHVVDPRTLVPLDEAGLVAAAAKTGRVVVVDEARDRCSAASHISAVLADKAFKQLKAPIKRVAVPNVCIPYAPNAEKRAIPDTERIAAVATEVARA